MRLLLLSIAGSLAACGGRAEPATPQRIAAAAVPGPPAAPVGDRIAAASEDPRLHRYQEHPELDNRCADDGACRVDEYGYACTALADVDDPIRSLPALPPVGATCGCVADTCIWYRPRGYDGVGARGRACDPRQRCLDGLSCVAGTCVADPPAPTATRVPAAIPTDGWYLRQEHPEVDNTCATDADCAIGGCAHYACVRALDAAFPDACRDAPARPPVDAACGCVRDTCVWWRAPRVAAVGPADPMRGYWEHDELGDACGSDADCEVERLGYACLARPAPALHDPIDDLPLPPAGAACGCLAGACAWWRSP